MANETTGRESDKFMLRLPDGMRDRIAEAAKANNRSMNAEIISRLQQTLDRPEGAERSDLLTPEGLEAMRGFAEDTARMLRELNSTTERVRKHALELIAEREALEARERTNPKPD